MIGEEDDEGRAETLGNARIPSLYRQPSPVLLFLIAGAVLGALWPDRARGRLLPQELRECLWGSQAEELQPGGLRQPPLPQLGRHCPQSGQALPWHDQGGPHTGRLQTESGEAHAAWGHISRPSCLVQGPTVKHMPAVVLLTINLWLTLYLPYTWQAAGSPLHI